VRHWVGVNARIMMVYGLSNDQEKTANRKSKIYRPKLLRVMFTDEKRNLKAGRVGYTMRTFKWNQDKTGNARDR